MPALLDIQDLSFARDHRVLACGLNLRVEAGTVVRVEGANGAGKTTLLRILAGLYTSYEGAVAYRGRDVRRGGHLELRASCHFLGHTSALKSGLTARENLEWLASLGGVAAGTQAIESVLHRVGLSGYEDVLCRQMSAGQQRRVALARLFLVPAKLWLLDEPFTALDKATVAALELWITDFARQGGAVILTTHHDPSHIPALQSLYLGGADA